FPAARFAPKPPAPPRVPVRQRCIAPCGSCNVSSSDRPVDDRSCACMYGILRRKEFLRHPCMCAPSQLVQRPIFLSVPGCIFGSLSMGCCAGAILDSYKPNQYGPPDFGGGYCRDLAKADAGVESMADDAREKGDREQPLDNEATLSARFKRLGEQLGQV